ncbi:MIF4G domain-containing protein isoform X1 [Loxodonta africana]|uniref:MIF4G domain-containing protein isoform X1 n=1 Tax=Loxodonta africana TaxID=9785 RepID=UPI0030D49648
MVMGEPSREEYKIQSFDAETQQLLKTALKDPGAVNLEKVANVIVDHSLQDCVFSKEAGRMCYAIIQAESKQAGQSVFRRGLLNRLQQEYQAREQLRARSLQGWVCYVTFICNIFDYLRVNNMPMMALVNPVYDCLFRLAQPDSLNKEEEVGGQMWAVPTAWHEDEATGHEGHTTVPGTQQALSSSALCNVQPCPSLTSRCPAGRLPGATAAPGRGAAGEDERAAHGRALCPHPGWLPASNGPQLPGPAAAAGDHRVPGSRLEDHPSSPEVLL